MNAADVDDLLKVARVVGLIALLAGVAMAVAQVATAVAPWLFWVGFAVLGVSAELLHRRKKRRKAQPGTVSSR